MRFKAVSKDVTAHETDKSLLQSADSNLFISVLKQRLKILLKSEIYTYSKLLIKLFSTAIKQMFKYRQEDNFR